MYLHKEEYLNGHNAAVEPKLSCGDGSEATLGNICDLSVHGCHVSLMLVNSPKSHFALIHFQFMTAFGALQMC